LRGKVTKTEKDAEKATKDPVMNYPIEWEEKAFQEVLQRFALAWQANTNLFRKLSKENNDLGISSFQIPLECFNGEESRPSIILFNRIIEKLIRPEPYLCRCVAYITELPEDFMTRQNFFEKHLRKFYWQGCMDVLHTDVLKDSDLAKSHKMTGIPLLSCYVGGVLNAILTTFMHYYTIDLVKLTGTQESIEELRIKRIQETSEGRIRDYTPFFKWSELKKNNIFEVFQKEWFDALLEYTDEKIDICLAESLIRTQTGKGDRRKDEFSVTFRDMIAMASATYRHDLK
jgi:hypothetical protein